MWLVWTMWLTKSMFCRRRLAVLAVCTLSVVH